MKSVVVKIGKSQYLVTEKQQLLVDRIKKDDKALKVGDSFETDQVLLFSDEKKIKIGQPFVKGITVTLKVLEENKGKKVRVATYKAKSRYRRTIGFRPIQMKVSVEKIAV
jgi:large subunit ribosomal protein L21